jgi:hypothetical protein
VGVPHLLAVKEDELRVYLDAWVGVRDGVPLKSVVSSPSSSPVEVESLIEGKEELGMRERGVGGKGAGVYGHVYFAFRLVSSSVAIVETLTVKEVKLGSYLFDGKGGEINLEEVKIERRWM